ncbi:hypothetical protein J7E99_18755 [Streptomyces sp. ISL-44]|nr:hypothetical protein [Streptomyces sp. ISL-44]
MLSRTRVRESTTSRAAGSSCQSGGTKRLYSGSFAPAGMTLAVAVSNSRRHLVAVGPGQRVVDVEEVELQRDVTARGRPPGEPGEETVAVQGHP